MDVCGEIFRCRQHSLKPLPAGARSRFTGPIPRGHLSPLGEAGTGVLDHFLAFSDERKPSSIFGYLYRKSRIWIERDYKRICAYEGETQL
jgi:hypothetical protein